MAEDDEPNIDVGQAADAATPLPEGAHQPSPWKGLTLIAQLGVPLAVLAIGIGLLAGLGPDGLLGGGDEENSAAPALAEADEVCREAFQQARQIARDPELSPGLGEWAALPEVLRDVAQRLRETDSPGLAPAFAEEADALDDLVASYEAGPLRRIRLARSRLREASTEAKNASLSEGQRSCARLARTAGALSRAKS
jgi:hypothetical protein